MSKTYESKVLEICDNGDAIIELPPELLQEMGWKEGDQLDLKLESGYVIITKLNKE